MFRNQVDFFGLSGLSSIEVVASKRTPRALSNADAEDERGDIVARSYYGSTDIFDIEVEFNLKNGSIDLSTLKLGKISPTVIALGIDGNTSNKDWPTLSFKGVETSLDISNVPTYTLPAITIQGKKLAQPIGVAVAEGCKLTGSGFSASVTLAENAPAGEVVALDVQGGEINGTAELVSVTAACSATATAGWQMVQDAGADESATAYGTSSVSVNKLLTKDA